MVTKRGARLTFTRTALLSLLAGSVCAQGAQPRYSVEEVPLTQISSDLARGKTTSVAVTSAYIARIKAYDGALNAIIGIAPDALHEAMQSDARRRAGRALSPLDGVPILLKDNIDAVGMPTTAGSFALIANLPSEDSEVARRLRAAGAVILGKTNLDQFASFRSTRSFYGSTVGGTPHNPYELDRSASGSSNGPGIAAAASFAAAAVGSDTTGSVIGPASYMGLVGMRPTVALISRRGIVPVSLSQDTAGPMARNVMDAAALLTVLAGSDSRDSQSREADAHKKDYVKGLNRDALRGSRLGVVRNVMGYDSTTRAIFDAALAVMRDSGATLIEIPVEELEDLYPEQLALMIYEFKEDLNAYLARTPGTVRTRNFAEMMRFNKDDPRENMHGQELFEQSLASGGRGAPEYPRTLEYARRRAGPEGLGRAMDHHNVTALVMLTSGPATRIVPDGSVDVDFVSPAPKGKTPIYGSGIAALARYPDLTVPMGQIDGLPLGISFIGHEWSEQALLSLGYSYEQAAHPRSPPPPLKPAPKANL